MMKNITSIDLKQKMDNGQAVLVDVREPAEFTAEHIPSAYSIPQSEVSLEKLPLKNKTVVFICSTGRRSSNVCEKFMNHHPELDVYSLTGGIKGWKEAGFTTVTSNDGVIPLERQIQLAAGTLVLLGVVCGAFVNNVFYLLSAFVGCGLMFAGITGWCGMGKLLARMPWNQ